MKALFDTNILLDYLKGVEAAQVELARYRQPLISIVTWLAIPRTFPKTSRHADSVSTVTLRYISAVRERLTE